MSNKKKVIQLGSLPIIKSTTKLILTLDCRDIYSDPKKSREITVGFSIRDNKLLIKPNKNYVEVGRLDQISLEDYCQEMNERPEYVWSNHKDLYKITLDKGVIDQLYTSKYCLTVEDLSLVYGYLFFREHKAFYNLCLCDFSEIPMEIQEHNVDGKDFDFIAVENKIVYPNCPYKIEFK